MNSPEKELQNKIWRQTHRRYLILVAREYRAKNAVKIKAKHRMFNRRVNRATLDTAKNYGRWWSEGDCFWLRSNMSLTLKQQAVKLGRTFWAVREKRRKLGISTYAHKRINLEMVVDGERPMNYEI